MLSTSTPTIRDATRDDLLRHRAHAGRRSAWRQRERAVDPLPQKYFDAFDAIQTHTGNHLLVAELDGKVVGCLQLTYIPGLSRLGLMRAQIESVRIDSSMRGRKLGELMIQDAVARAPAWLRTRPAHHRQGARRRATLLRAPRLRGDAYRDEVELEVVALQPP